MRVPVVLLYAIVFFVIQLPIRMQAQESDTVQSSGNVEGATKGATDVSARLWNTENRRIISAKASGYAGKSAECDNLGHIAETKDEDENTESFASFSLTLSGEIENLQGERGKRETYFATRTKRGNIYIRANESNSPNITVPHGETVSFYLKESLNDSPVDGDWKVSLNGSSTQEKKSAQSITFNRTFWGNIVSWFTDDASVKTPKPGIYSISATRENQTTPKANGELTVVDVSKISAESQNRCIESSAVSAGVNETLYAIYGASFSVKAYKTPEAVSSWPVGYPLFKVNSQWISTSNSSGIEKNKEVAIGENTYTLDWQSDDAVIFKWKTMTLAGPEENLTIKAICDKDDDNGKSVIISFIYPDAKLMPCRPVTDGPSYGSPFRRRVVVNEAEKEHIGIRLNTDNESASDENDLIEVQLQLANTHAAETEYFIIKRSNDGIRLWNSRTKQNAILDDTNENNEAEIQISKNSPTTFWVEKTKVGNSTISLISRVDEVDTLIDSVTFKPFSSIVVILGGEDQNPSDPADSNHGTFKLAIQLYEQGYDVHMYDEDVVDCQGNGLAYNEIVDAIKKRGVNNVAIIGYSHGGGSTHDLANKLNSERQSIGSFNISLTAYIDAIKNSSFFDMVAETRFPPGSLCHLNFFHVGDGILEGGNVQGASLNEMKNDYDHFQIDDDPGILGQLFEALTRRILIP